MNPAPEEMLCPECTYRGPPTPDGACPKCRAADPEQALALHLREDAGVLDRTLYLGETLVTGGLSLAARGASGAASLGCLAYGLMEGVRFLGEMHDVVVFSQDLHGLLGGASVVFIPLLRFLWLLVTLAPVALVGWLTWQFATTGRIPFLRSAGIRVDDAEAGITSLHGRRGLGITLSVVAASVPRDTRVEVAVRLVDSRGNYLPAALERYRGERGEARGRVLSLPRLERTQVFLQLGVFLPLRGLRLPTGSTRLQATAEVVVLADGSFLGEHRLPVEISLEPGDLVPSLLDEPEGLEVVARTLVRPASACPVCGDGLDDQLVTCSSCETPHHPECWDFAGQCSTYACEGRAEDRAPEAPRAASGRAPAVSAIEAEVIPADLRPRSLQLGPGNREPSLPSTVIPSRPRPLTEQPLVAGAICLIGGASPYLLALAASQYVSGAVLGMALVALALVAGPDVLLAPASRALDHWQRHFPGGELRSYRRGLQLRRVRWAEPWRHPEQVLELELTMLARRLAGAPLQVVCRVRDAAGFHLQPRLEGARGRYGELRWIAEAPALKEDAPRRVVLRAAIPAAQLPLPPKPGPLVLELEGLLFQDDAVVAEFDVPFAFHPEEGTTPAAGKPSSDLRVEVDVYPPNTTSTRAASCPLCEGELGRYEPTCLSCRVRCDEDCWQFCGGCPRCGAGDYELAEPSLPDSSRARRA